MDLTIILNIVGFFLTLMLGVNAFFLRGIFLDLGDVKIKMASIFENSKSKEKRLNNVEEYMKELEIRVREIELRLK
jgi:hypothetical protein